jgi:hypothetical protein
VDLHDQEADEDYDPRAKRGKKKAKPSLNPPETGRVLQHTLDEFHDHLLMSTSFEGNNSLLGIDYSSSQAGAAGLGSYMINDDIFAEGNLGGEGVLDGFGDIVDDLARELGEGWGVDVGNLQRYISLDSVDELNVKH